MSGSTALQNLVQSQNVYGNATDLASAKNSLGNGYNYIDTSAQGYQAPTNYTGSLIVGGAGAIGGVANSSGGTRLAGLNSTGTANAINTYLNNSTSGNTQNVYGNATDIANAKATLGNGYNYIDTSTNGYMPGTYTNKDIVVGGIGATGGVADSGNAWRLAGSDSAGTNQAIQGYANQKSLQATQATDNSGQISDMYGQSLLAAQDALKASIAESQQGYQDTINKAPGQFQPLRNQASAAGAQNMQNLQETLANNGQQGGVNRTENTQVSSNTENNINSLNTQQQGVIDTANKAINDLQAQGDIKGAELVAQNASDKIKALIDESNRVSSTNAAAKQQTFNNGVSTAGLTGTYNGSQTVAGKVAQSTIEAQTASTAYQTLINQAYPKEEALKIAGIVSSNAGLVLDNNAKAIANKYAPQIAQGTIDGQKLTNTYQGLVNNGYTAAQAADIAVKYSSIDVNNASITSSLSNSSGGSGGQVASGGVVPSQYVDDINGAAAQYGISPQILAGILDVESGFDPNAHNASGADGMAQFLPSTAKEQGVNTKDAKSSIYGAAKYLALRTSQDGGNIDKGIMSYGEGTTAYLNKVLAAAGKITITPKLTAAQTTAQTKANQTTVDKAADANFGSLKTGQQMYNLLNDPSFQADVSVTEKSKLNNLYQKWIANNPTTYNDPTHPYIEGGINQGPR